jgi:tetratricopeptide (TPR) repeat protein
VEQISGALLNVPILWAAAAVPALALAGARRTDRRLPLACAAFAWVALSSLLLLSFFFGACSRYQFEFVPALALLASVGLMELEGSQPRRLRAVARCAWIPALAISCAFPVLYGIERCASDHNYYGIARLLYGDPAGAQQQFRAAQSLSPRNPFSRLGLALVLESERRPAEAQRAFEELIRDFPDDATAHYSLGNLLRGEGRPEEALPHYQAAHRLDPQNANIAAALDLALAAARPPP